MAEPLTDRCGSPMTGESPLIELVEMMARLRAECGWKAAQTHRTLAKHLLEETYETLEAIEALDEGGDPDHLREELGDVLLQVYLHAAIAAQAGAVRHRGRRRGAAAEDAPPQPARLR